MAETQETTADIIAKMRKTKYGDEECEVKWCLTPWADRLEAAYKRERGDCAKLREALKDIVRIVEQIRLLYSDYPYETHLIARKAKAALAAPPRNCDRFGGDIDKLREACARERGLNPEEDFPDVFPDWLLSPSTKQEGGNNGNE